MQTISATYKQIDNQLLQNNWIADYALNPEEQIRSPFENIK